MRFSDYVCDRCNLVFDYGKKDDLESFPKNVTCPECGKKDKTRRIFSNVMSDVAEGKHGNAKTGYNNSVAYHPSKFGAYKGKKVT